MIDKRRLAENLTDAMVRLLHFQEKGEPDWQSLSYAEARDLCEAVPQSLIDRYQNEVLFRNQVQRAVSTIMHLVQEAKRAADQSSAARCNRCHGTGFIFEAGRPATDSASHRENEDHG